MENRVDSIKSLPMSAGVEQMDTKNNRRSSRLQSLKCIETESKKSVKLPISPSKKDKTSEQSTKLNDPEPISKEHSEHEICMKKYKNLKFHKNDYVETEDVSKVFKLLSKPNFHSNIKSSLKVPLKTYTNPRKSLEKNEIIESFGLPDTPIVPEKLLVDNNLDTEVLDAKEITIQDLQFVEEPWCLIDIEESFTDSTEIRIKTCPHDHTTAVSLNSSTITKNINSNNAQQLSFVNAANILDRNTATDKKSFPSSSPNKPEIILENNSVALDAHEVEICKVNTFDNTSNCNLTTVNTNKLIQENNEKCIITSKIKDYHSNHKNIIQSSSTNKYFKNETETLGRVNKNNFNKNNVNATERRKLRSSNLLDDVKCNSKIKLSKVETSRRKSKTKYNSKNGCNERWNFENTFESELKKPCITINPLKSDKNAFNVTEKQKQGTSDNATECLEDNLCNIHKQLFNPVEVRILRSSITDLEASTVCKSVAKKSDNQPGISVESTQFKNLNYAGESFSPYLDTPRETNIGLKGTSKNKRFSSPRKVPLATEAVKKDNFGLSTPPDRKINGSIKNCHKNQCDDNSTTRILRSHSCSEIILNNNDLNDAKSTKVSKSSNSKVSNEIECNIENSCLVKSKSDPFLLPKGTFGNYKQYSKQLKVILHPLKKSLKFQTGKRKNNINNTNGKRNTPIPVDKLEKPSRSCEMLLELIDIIPVSDKPKDSSTLLQSKPFLNLFKNSELPLPTKLSDETKKTTNGRKPEIKKTAKNNVDSSSTSKQDDNNSNSTKKDEKLLRNLDLPNNKSKDSVEYSTIVSNSDQNSPCKVKTLPEKKSSGEMRVSLTKSKTKISNKVKKLPDSKSEITELKNLIKKINENEGRKCKVLTNEKLSECLKARSYIRRSNGADMDPYNIKLTKSSPQVVENKINSFINTSKLVNVLPPDKLRYRTRKTIETLTENIPNSVTSVESKIMCSFVPSENTSQKKRDLHEKKSENKTLSCDIMLQKEMDEEKQDLHENKSENKTLSCDMLQKEMDEEKQDLNKNKSENKTLSCDMLQKEINEEKQDLNENKSENKTLSCDTLQKEMNEEKQDLHENKSKNKTLSYDVLQKEMSETSIENHKTEDLEHPPQNLPINNESMALQKQVFDKNISEFNTDSIKVLEILNNNQTMVRDTSETIEANINAILETHEPLTEKSMCVPEVSCSDTSKNYEYLKENVSELETVLPNNFVLTSPRGRGRPKKKVKRKLEKHETTLKLNREVINVNENLNIPNSDLFKASSTEESHNNPLEITEVNKNPVIGSQTEVNDKCIESIREKNSLEPSSPSHLPEKTKATSEFVFLNNSVDMAPELETTNSGSGKDILMITNSPTKNRDIQLNDTVDSSENTNAPKDPITQSNELEKKEIIENVDDVVKNCKDYTNDITKEKLIQVKQNRFSKILNSKEINKSEHVNSDTTEFTTIKDGTTEVTKSDMENEHLKKDSAKTSYGFTNTGNNRRESFDTPNKYEMKTVDANKGDITENIEFHKNDANFNKDDINRSSKLSMDNTKLEFQQDSCGLINSLQIETVLKGNGQIFKINNIGNENTTGTTLCLNENFNEIMKNNNADNYINEDTIEGEKLTTSDNYKEHSRKRNQKNFLDEVSVMNESVDDEVVEHLEANDFDIFKNKDVVESSVCITSRLRSKTSLVRSHSFDLEETPLKNGFSRKSRTSEEFSPKTPTKLRGSKDKNQNKDHKANFSPRSRYKNGILPLSEDDEVENITFKEKKKKNSLSDDYENFQCHNYSDNHELMETISTRTRSKTSLGERFDEDLKTNTKIVRSKTSLGMKINDDECNFLSQNKNSLADNFDYQQSKESDCIINNTTNAAVDLCEKNQQFNGFNEFQSKFSLDMKINENSMEKKQLFSPSKHGVSTAEYFNSTCDEKDPSNKLYRRSYEPVGEKNTQMVKRSYSVGPVKYDDANSTSLKPKIGDIVWAQIGKFPYWPSLITKDPESKSFKNIIKNKWAYHVKFFGDKGRRAWINGKKILEYKSKDDLEIRYKNLKGYKNAAELHLYIIRQHIKNRWLKAVEEVDYVKSHDFTYKQIINYIETGRSGDELLNKEPQEEESSPSPLKKSLKRKQPLSTEGTPEDINNQSKKIKMEVEESSQCKEKSPRKGTTKDIESTENSITIPSKMEINREDSTSSNDNNKDEHFIVIKDEHSDTEYKINSNTLKNFGSYTLEEQRALFKRNNLFKGVPKEKVCQYCFDFGELLKCKGGCNGLYHPYCATQILLEKQPKRKKARRSFKSEDIEKVEFIKTETPETTSSLGNQLDVDNHVQIVTIPSSVYNTPPKRTFPPNFVNMTLGERIDFKMKEIMKKFECTTYTEVLSESSSEEKSSNMSLVRSNFSAKCQDLFSVGVQRSPQQNVELDKELDSMLQNDITTTSLSPSAKSIKHITADSPTSSCQSDGVSKTQNSSSEMIINNDSDLPIKHITADCEYSSDAGIKSYSSTKKEIKNQSQQRNSLMAHITADSPFSMENTNLSSKFVETKFNGERKSKYFATKSSNFDLESLGSTSSTQSKQSIMSENADAYRNINPKNFKCGFCVQNVDPYCFICNETVSKEGYPIRQKCSLYQCSRFYHPECFKLWPQTQWSVIQTTKNRYSQEEVDSFVCPQHVCHTCASDDPRAAISRCSWDKIVKCLCCPASYHSTNLCVPAGTEIITSTQIICPRHRSKCNKQYTINTTWCLLCNQGGNLICCETCPTSVHPECMTVSLTDDDRFICEDCESGRLPLYDEVVWVKLGNYKWWPALIIFPNEVPLKVYNAKHSSGEFVVKFFGTYNYYWMNRGRAFLFQEGDTADTGLSTKKKVEAAFLKAVEEAVVAHKMKKQFKRIQAAESANSLKPPPYIKIKISKPVGNVRFMELDLSNTTACDCDPNQLNPCGPDSNCLNRLLLTECNPEACPAGKSCKNQSFEKREYPLLIPYKTESRGWGLKTLEPIKKGQFVIEYVGELIDDEEYQRRILKMHAQKEENYYFLTIHKDRMIDAGPKGNMARFMNHCCQPNCETQKWTVNGDTRVGLFATVDIPAHTELTFNYNLECTGTEKKVCRCGAPNCSGFIGVKVKNETMENKKPKKERKKKEPEKPIVLPPCFLCQKKGNVSLCNNKICNKAYHLRCLNLKEMPDGKKFVCPWHYCNICSKRTIRCCIKCLNSFCPSHSEGNVRYDNLMGFICSTHEPTNIKSQTNNTTLKKKRNHVTVDEAVVTSTTDDNDDDDDEDDVSLLQRQRQLKKKKNNAALENENDNFNVSDSSTVNPANEDDSESQNDTVSSATASDFEDEFRSKRKNKRKKRLQKKRLKLKFTNSKVNNKVMTANSEYDTNVFDATR